ncbi:unnamed protein product, partial [Strongylus vulgaris]
MPALGIQVELEYQPLSKKQLDTHMNAICGNIIGELVMGTLQCYQVLLPNRPLSNDHGWCNDLGAIGVERKKTRHQQTFVFSHADASFFSSRANPLKLAQAQAQAAQLQALLQNNGLSDPNLLMQARLRSLVPGVDPLLALGGLSSPDGPGEGGALLGGGQRTSPQELLNP